MANFWCGEDISACGHSTSTPHQGALSMKPQLTLQMFTVLFAMTAGIALAADSTVALTGAQETPTPITTDAKGTSTIKVGTDKSVSGSVKTTGVVGTMAHIHLAAKGKSGP